MAVIIKMRDLYLEWCTISDSPRTYFSPIGEFRAYYLKEYGTSSEWELDRRLKRVDEIGTSCMLSSSLEDFLECNRAGPGETFLTVNEIFEGYQKPKLTELQTEAISILEALFEDEKWRLTDFRLYGRMTEFRLSGMTDSDQYSSDVVDFMDEVCRNLLDDRAAKFGNPHMRDRLEIFLTKKDCAPGVT